MADVAEERPTSAQPVGEWLETLGSAAPAPGGGAAAALSACLGAALVEMVCNLTIGKPAFADYEKQVTAIRDEARGLRLAGLAQADADVTAFRELMATFRLPRQTSEDQAARSAAIQAATLRAASVPLEIAATGAEVARLAAQLPGRSNPNVLSDVGVAAECAAAAIEAAALNVEINIGSLADEATRDTLRDHLARHRVAAKDARRLASDVRREISR